MKIMEEKVAHVSNLKTTSGKAKLVKKLDLAHGSHNSHDNHQDHRSQDPYKA